MDFVAVVCIQPFYSLSSSLSLQKLSVGVTPLGPLRGFFGLLSKNAGSKKTAHELFNGLGDLKSKIFARKKSSN